MEYEKIALIALIYEACINAINLSILIMVYRRKHEKETDLTKLLLFFFLSWYVASLFLLVQKFINFMWGGVPYQDISRTALYFVGLLHSARFGYVCVILGSMCAYEVYLRVFKSRGGLPERQRKITLIIGVLISIYLATAYQFDYEIGRENPIFMVFGFAFLFLYVIIVYFPFTIEAFKLATRLTYEEPTYKKGIQSLGIMALSVILLFISFIIDQVLLVTSGIRYSAFYFLGWAIVVIGLYMAYAGYIKPGNASH